MKKLYLNKHQQPADAADQITIDESAQISQNQNSDQVINEFAQKKAPMKVKKSPQVILIGVGVLAILAGIATGYGGYKLRSSGGSGSGPAPMQQVAEEGKVKAGDVFGVQDEETFKDRAEGYLEKGGVDGEGSHKLLRPGGDSQTVYLTSSVTDLDKFAGMEVKIWGETFKAQKAGWLMDVGRVEVINPQGEAPMEE
ncbi:MAG: hypothetical protein GF390_03530 [Candidatus Pacebacteria bacterium]|nr:hypothetical protein [Candidatus Paceibacterota bacterium]